MTVEGPITDATITELCDRLRVVLDTSDVDVVTCDVRSITHADVATLDALARLQLTARRLGRSIRLCHLRSPVHDLLHLAGWSEILSCCADQPRRIELGHDPTSATSPAASVSGPGIQSG